VPPAAPVAAAPVVSGVGASSAPTTAEFIDPPCYSLWDAILDEAGTVNWALLEYIKSDNPQGCQAYVWKHGTGGMNEMKVRDSGHGTGGMTVSERQVATCIHSHVFAHGPHSHPLLLFCTLSFSPPQASIEQGRLLIGGFRVVGVDPRGNMVQRRMKYAKFSLAGPYSLSLSSHHTHIHTPLSLQARIAHRSSVQRWGGTR
jgi:hypothetical protein